MAIYLNEDNCKGCGCCTDVCFEGAMELAAGHVRISEDYCTECGACMDMCPSGALEPDGNDAASDPPSTTPNFIPVL